MMSVKELRKASGMTQQQFGDYFGIPKRTIQNWEAGVNKCPEYLLRLMEYKLEHEGLIRADMERGGEDGKL
jgi:DNA-binding transcriptional regulator YiaG